MKNFESLTPGDYIAILRNRMWYVIVTTILVSVGTVIYVLRIPPSYTSETTILVAERVVPENYVDSIVRENKQERIEFVRQQLESRTFLQKIVQEFQLAAPGASDSEGVINGVRARSLLTPLSANTFRLSFTATDPRLAQAVTRRLAERVIQLNESFRKEKVYGTDQFMDEQLRQAAEQLSKVEEKLRQFYSKHFPGVPRDGASFDTLSALQTQLTTAEGNLQNLIDVRKSIERRVEEQKQLKVVTRSTAPETRATSSERDTPAPIPVAAPPSALEQKLAAKRADLSIALTKYTALYPEVIVLTQEVKELETLVNQERARAAAARPAPQTPTNQNRPALPVVPEVDSADFLVAEFQLELNRVNKDIVTAEQSKEQIAARVAAYQSRMNPPPELAQELGALNREYETAKQQYTDISARKAKAGLASEADTGEGSEIFKVIDEANLPQHATGPNRRFLAAGGCFAGLLLGLGAAFGRELMDSSLKDEEQATSELKIPVLASIPEVETELNKKSFKKRKKDEGLSLLDLQATEVSREEAHLQIADSCLREVIGNSPTIAGEHFRLLRTKLSAMQKAIGLKSLVITSAIPNEGKTFSASCLAAIMAQEPGKKVLLIDADLRTGNAGRMLGVGWGTIGLTDLLGDGVSSNADLLQQSLIKCSDAHWYFLPAGPAVPNPSELLSSPALATLMQRVQEQFDWVIVDAPPVLAVADANVLSTLCDAALFVLYAGKTSLSLVKDAVKRLGPERICGLVMNRVRYRKAVEYYYSYYPRQGSSRQSTGR